MTVTAGAGIRALFDLPEDITYLDCAAQGPLLRASHTAGARGLLRKFHPWTPERAAFDAEMTAARDLFAGLIGARGQDIAHMGATSYGAAVAGANMAIEPGQKVLVLEAQFPSNYYVWQRLAARDGGDLKIVPWPEDGDWTAAVLDALGDDVGLVALPPCHWTDGALLDLVAIADRVHALGAGFFIDATQAAGARPLDVGRLDPDFMAVSGYKWLLSPDAVGYLYVAPRRQTGAPIEDNYATRVAESTMEMADGYGADYIPGAARFDQGAADSMIHLPITVTAMEQISQWTPEGISAGLAPLTDAVAARAEERGWRVPAKGRRVDHFIGVWISDVPADLGQRLKARGVYTSLRGGAVRVSPHLYNSVADIDRLFAALDAEMTG